MNKIEKTIRAYDKIARDYEQKRGSDYRFSKEFKTFKKLVKGKKVLEIGCGGGRDAALFIENRFDYVGIDASKNLLKIAKKKVPSGKFLRMNFLDLDFPANSFDGFWASASLLHCPRKKLGPVLRQIWKFLKPEGIGFISVKPKKTASEKLVCENGNKSIVRYFAFFTKEEFSGFLKNAGFEVLQSYKSAAKEADGSKTVWLDFFVKK